MLSYITTYKRKYMIKCFGKRISFKEEKFNKEKCFPYSEHLLEQQKGSIRRYMLRLFMISYIILQPFSRSRK